MAREVAAVTDHGYDKLTCFGSGLILGTLAPELLVWLTLAGLAGWAAWTVLKWAVR